MSHIIRSLKKEALQQKLCQANKNVLYSGYALIFLVITGRDAYYLISSMNELRANLSRDIVYQVT